MNSSILNSELIDDYFCNTTLLSYLRNTNNLITYKYEIKRVVLNSLFTISKFNESLCKLNAINPVLIYKEQRVSPTKFNGVSYECYFKISNGNTTNSDAILHLELYKPSSYIKCTLYFMAHVLNERAETIIHVLQNFITYLTETFPAIVNQNSSVPITFVHATNQGKLDIQTREIICPHYNEINQNYPSITCAINDLLSLPTPDQVGKFIFWWGPPGTGKTTLIRALAQAYKKTTKVYYIIDPERFISDSNYMQKIVLAPHNDDEIADYVDDNVLRTSYQYSNNIPIKLFIIEDGLNYIMTDSSYKEGGAVSRLLNITDGFLGDGLRLLFLVTSNEKVENIDPAFLRAGRCIQSLKFPLFTYEQAKTWLANHDPNILLPTTSSFSLAELYSILHKYKIPTAKPNNLPIGFKGVPNVY